MSSSLWESERILLAGTKKNGKHGVKRPEEFSTTQANDSHGTRNHAHLGLVNILTGADYPVERFSLGLLLRPLAARLDAQAPEPARHHRAEYSSWLDGPRLDRRLRLVALLAGPR